MNSSSDIQLSYKHFYNLYAVIIEKLQETKPTTDTTFLKQISKTFVDVLNNQLNGTKKHDVKKSQLIQYLEQLKSTDFIANSSNNILNTKIIDAIKEDLESNCKTLKDSISKSPAASIESFIDELQKLKELLKPVDYDEAYLVQTAQINFNRAEDLRSKGLYGAAIIRYDNALKALSSLKETAQPKYETKFDLIYDKLSYALFSETVLIFKSPHFHLHIDEAIEKLTLAIDALAHIKNKNPFIEDIIALYSYNLAKFHFMKGNLLETNEALENCLAALNNIPDTDEYMIFNATNRKEKVCVEQVSTYIQRGVDYYRKNEFDEALICFEKGSALFDTYFSDKLDFQDHAFAKSRLLYQTALVHFSIGVGFRMNGESEKAKRNLERAFHTTSQAITLMKNPKLANPVTHNSNQIESDIPVADIGLENHLNFLELMSSTIAPSNNTEKFPYETTSIQTNEERSLKKCLEIFELNSTMLGHMEFKNKKYTTALEYFEKSLSALKEIGTEANVEKLKECEWNIKQTKSAIRLATSHSVFNTTNSNANSPTTKPTQQASNQNPKKSH